MLDKINQIEFEKILEILIIYKKLNPKLNVFLNEKSIKKALEWHNNIKNNNN